MYRGLIAAAGLGTRLGDLAEQRNKVLLDLGGESILATILANFRQAAIDDVRVVVGFDARSVRLACEGQAQCVLNPFYRDSGILSSLWMARPHLDGIPFVFSVGDNYSSPTRFLAFLADQPDADVLVDVELKVCDEEDMKVYLNRVGKLRTVTKAELAGPILGEFTGVVRFSADGSSQFFKELEQYAWQHGVQGYMADVLCSMHRQWELAFHLSQDHHRVEVDFPCDLLRARQLYAQHKKLSRKVG